MFPGLCPARAFLFIPDPLYPLRKAICPPKGTNQAGFKGSKIGIAANGVIIAGILRTVIVKSSFCAIDPGI